MVSFAGHQFTGFNTVRLFFMGLCERDCFCCRANNFRWHAESHT